MLFPEPNRFTNYKSTVKIQEATENFERWLAAHVSLVPHDIKYKHLEMSTSPFAFLRAAFYRWAQLWPQICPKLSAAPKVLAVGDLHVENFGTWRDMEGRLIWGINDFDEVFPFAYTADLVRLATSAHLAIAIEGLCIGGANACKAIEDGYRDSLRAGGRAFVLAEDHSWLRKIALNELRDPVHFWARMKSLPRITGEIPRDARKLIEETLPQKGMAYSLLRRLAGLGSLGHPRIVALADWGGGYIAREAKGVRPSACIWATGTKRNLPILSPKLISKAVRVPDSCVRYQVPWMVRRLAPDCSRIELSSLPEKRDETRLLYSMGWETANIHLASRSAIPAVRKDLAKRSGKWLLWAAKSMAAEITRDWKKWRRA
ncbi:MAG TPA: DUF2252 family protein [Candidatus Dormibacteraeota bacterium]|nr:DUF2252 family protein [Candidatus Dormibacteraeota bacterium]